MNKSSLSNKYKSLIVENPSSVPLLLELIV